MLREIIQNTLAVAQKSLNEEMERKNFAVVFKIQSEIRGLKNQLSMLK